LPKDKNKPSKIPRVARGDSDVKNTDELEDEAGVSSDESEDEASEVHESEDETGLYCPSEDGEDPQDDDSIAGSFDSENEVLVEEAQQYLLYVGYWNDVPHVVDFQIRSKLPASLPALTLAIIVNLSCKVRICKSGQLSWTTRRIS
jgi:hypothetical protein